MGGVDTVIAIDPGRRTGWACFEHGQLTGAGCRDAAQMLRELLPGLTARELRWEHSIVVIEKPKIYPFGMGKGDQNQLIDLAILVGDLRGRYRELHGLPVELVEPRTWKGTVPKAIHNQRTLAKLSGAERAVLPKRPRARDYDHNMLDAVGLGLWQLEREGQRT